MIKIWIYVVLKVVFIPEYYVYAIQDPLVFLTKSSFLYILFYSDNWDIWASGHFRQWKNIYTGKAQNKQKLSIGAVNIYNLSLKKKKSYLQYDAIKLVQFDSSISFHSLVNHFFSSIVFVKVVGFLCPFFRNS